MIPRKSHKQLTWILFTFSLFGMTARTTILVWSNENWMLFPSFEQVNLRESMFSFSSGVKSWNTYIQCILNKKTRIVETLNYSDPFKGGKMNNELSACYEYLTIWWFTKCINFQQILYIRKLNRQVHCEVFTIFVMIVPIQEQRWCYIHKYQTRKQIITKTKITKG